MTSPFALLHVTVELKTDPISTIMTNGLECDFHEADKSVLTWLFKARLT